MRSQIAVDTAKRQGNTSVLVLVRTEPPQRAPSQQLQVPTCNGISLHDNWAVLESWPRVFQHPSRWTGRKRLGHLAWPN